MIRMLAATGMAISAPRMASRSLLSDSEYTATALRRRRFLAQATAAQGVLFAKIEDAQVAEWSERFGGADA